MRNMSSSARIVRLDDSLTDTRPQEGLVAYAAENPAKHNLMIWNVAIYWTRVVRNIVFVELRLTLVYRLQQKRSPRRRFPVSRVDVLCLKLPGASTSTFRHHNFIRLGNPVSVGATCAQSGYANVRRPVRRLWRATGFLEQA
jgi:hypothetical protein